jgi:zinc protease
MISGDFLATGDIHFSRAYVDGIQRVTLDQVRDVARKYLHPKNFATIAVLPEGYQRPHDASMARAEPSPVRLITLNNGLRLLIRRDPTTPLVSIQAFALGGVYYEDEHTSGLSRMAAMLAPRGTATRSAEEIARFFDSRGGSFGGASGNNTIFFQAQVLSKDFPQAMEVVGDVVCHPAFPAEELERFRPMFVDQIRQIDESWRSELAAYFRSRFYIHSPYRFETVGREDVVANASRDDVAKFYARHVTGPQTVLAIFGDVDLKLAESLARRYFQGLPAGDVPAPEVKEEPAFEQPQLFIKKKGAERNVAGVALGFHGMTFENTEDAAPLAVLDTIISGYRFPTGWLHEALRGGDRSYVYEVHAQNYPGLSPGYFWMYAGCQPEKVGEVYDIITGQLERARRGEATEEELQRAKTIIATTELMGLQTHSERAMQTAIDELYGLGYDYRDRFLEAVRGVTLADVKYVAEKYLTVPVITVVTNAPEAIDIGVEPILIQEAE